MTKTERNTAIDQYIEGQISFSELENALRIWNAQVRLENAK